MKNIFTLFIGCLLSGFAIAQTNITADDMPSAGVTQAVFTQNAPAIDLGSPSDVAQVWDFSNLNSLNMSTVYYQETEGMEGEEEFPNAEFVRDGNLLSILGLSLGDLLPVAAETFNALAYFSTDDDGSVFIDGFNIDLSDLLGGDTPPVNAVSDPSMRFLSVGTYASTYDIEGGFLILVDTEGSLNLGLVGIDIVINGTSEADAHGNLILPDEEYEALRYREDMEVQLSVASYIEVLGQPIPIATLIDTTVNVTNYRFLSKGIGHPVASVTTNPGDSQDIISIDYVGEPIQLAAGFTYASTCENAQFTNNSTGLITGYFWDFGDGTTSTDPNPLHTFPSEDDYTVSLTVSNPTGDLNTYSETIVVDCILNSVPQLSEMGISIYPNPVQDYIQIDLPYSLESSQLSIYNSLGQEIRTEFINNTRTSLDVSDLSSGFYLLKMTNESGVGVQPFQVSR